MSWLSRLFRKPAPLDPGLSQALSALRAIPAADRNAGIAVQRLVVVDVETSGLDPHTDRLLAIGAVGVKDGLIRLEDSFQVVLRQEAASGHDNILVHGIDGTTQRSGTEHPEALVRFLEYIRKDPLVGFHADFDQAAIDRAMRFTLGFTPDNPWMDLAVAAPVLFPEHARRARTLDEWTRVFGIENPARHNALADAYATAQLLLVTIARAQSAGERRLGDLLTASTPQRWLPR